MTIRNAIASLAVADLEAAIPWYERLLGRAPDSRPVEEVAEWRFERGGWLQLYQGPERAGAGTLTLSVSSVEEQAAELRSCGLDPGTPIVTDRVRVLMIRDPDGNSIAFAEPLDPTIAQ
jgi:catechol 2,3-dioxygenase-like lactoylglutathione lyase family enzyme